MLAAMVQSLLIVQQYLHFKLPCVSLVLYSTMRKHSDVVRCCISREKPISNIKLL